MALLYLDCSAGASGDMILAALIDAGAEIETIRKHLAKLDLALEISTETVVRSGLSAVGLTFGPVTSSSIGGYQGAVRLITEAGLDPAIESRALGVLRRIADAEAHVHAEDPADVDLHEIDAADTIADAVGVAAAMVQLGIDEVVCSPIATGTGTIPSHHGPLPLPAPAVLKILEGAPIYARPVKAELITPTGAAIIAEWASEFGEIPPMIVSHTGYGAGSRDLEIPNVLRAIIGERFETSVDKTEAVLIEANIDDMNPEFYEYVMERLFEAGASDVWLAPAIGKYGRPMNVLTVLVPTSLHEAIREIILAETSTLGLRATPVEKWALGREWIEVHVEGQPIRVKIAKRGDRIVNVSPEYSDCAGVARATRLPLKKIFQAAAAEAGRVLGGRERS